MVSSPPITLALPALLGAFAHVAPLVVNVRDVFPDVAVKIGAWKADSPVASFVEPRGRRPLFAAPCWWRA